MSDRPAAGPGAGRDDHRRAVRFVAGSGLLFLVAACATPEPPSVVLITIDALRADHLGCHGYPRPVSPRIDAFAREAALFERATTTLPRTTPAVASILTGRLPKSHGARGLLGRLSPANTTLAEIMKGEGYATAAITSNGLLRPGLGFEQGFDLYDNPEGRWEADSAEAVVGSAIAWLDKADGKRPFFLWVHLLDPHWRYEPGAPWDRAFDPGFDEPFTLYEDLAAGRLTEGQVIFGDVLTPRQREHVIALYDGEIARTDAAVGLLLDRIARLGRPVLTVLTADHGESLGEHGYHFAHGEYLYEQGLHIPLIVHYPGVVEAGSRHAGAALNIDVAPTILALTRLPGMQGVEGRPLLRPGTGRGSPLAMATPGRTLIWAESDFQGIHPENPRHAIDGPEGRWSAAGDGRYKLIRIPRADGALLELYDLENDPGEAKNLVADPAFDAIRARLLRAVLEFSDSGAGLGAPGGDLN